MTVSKLKVAASLVVLALLVGVTVALAGQAPPEKAAGAREPEPPKPAITFRQVDVTARDLLEVTGLNVYKFRLDVKKGERFGLEVRQWPAEGQPYKPLWYHDFKVQKDGPVDLRLCLLCEDGKLRGALGTEDREVQLRVDCDGCRPGGLGTFIPNPAGIVPVGGRTLWWNRDGDAAFRTGPDASSLLVVMPSQHTPIKDVASIYPRGEISLLRLPKSD